MAQIVSPEGGRLRSGRSRPPFGSRIDKVKQAMAASLWGLGFRV